MIFNCGRIQMINKDIQSYQKMLTFFLEIHLDVVLKVLLMVGFYFIFYKICRQISQEDSLKKLGILSYKQLRYLTFQQLKKKTSSRSLSYKTFDKDKRGGEGMGGEGVCFPEKVMSHYGQYNLFPCIEELTVYRQTDRKTELQTYRQTDRVNCRGALLLKIRSLSYKKIH